MNTSRRDQLSAGECLPYPSASEGHQERPVIVEVTSRGQVSRQVAHTERARSSAGGHGVGSRAAPGGWRLAVGKTVDFVLKTR